jgi:hypothetical protein
LGFCAAVFGGAGGAGGAGGGGGPVDADGFTSLITLFTGVSGYFGIILSLALKYDGCSLIGADGSIFVLFNDIVSFNIFDVIKDDNKLLLLSG